jgi:hypothetical protein
MFILASIKNNCKIMLCNVGGMKSCRLRAISYQVTRKVETPSCRQRQGTTTFEYPAVLVIFQTARVGLRYSLTIFFIMI